MAYTFLFFEPSRLPLEPDELMEAAMPFADAAEVRAKLAQHFPGLRWADDSTAQVEAGGRWLEFHLRDEDDGSHLSLRCSLRADYRDVVQGLCDAFGWVACDETPLCFQPHRPPMPC